MFGIALTVLLLGQNVKPQAGFAPLYPHGSVTARQLGTGARSYWLFEPTEPAPSQAPVIVFCHGWLATNPGLYGAWIEHLARRGFVVIFPRYQEDWLTAPVEFLPNAVASIRDALDVLQTAPGHVRPDRSRFALIGHSAGGNLVALLAASAEKNHLPEPRAVVVLLPGEVRPVAAPTIDRIPASVNLVVAACDQDLVVGDGRARGIFNGAKSVPESRKLYVLFRTDRSGPVPIVADHTAPCAWKAQFDTGEGPFRAFQLSHAGVDLLDHFGFWRMTDVTLDASFAGVSLARATQNGQTFRDLGHWGNGRAILAPVVGTDLDAIPRVIPTYGLRLLPFNPDDWLHTMNAMP